MKSSCNKDTEADTCIDEIGEELNDTACEYSAMLETEMNRKRQSQVTADVIEISSEFSMKGDI